MGRGAKDGLGPDADTDAVSLPDAVRRVALQDGQESESEATEKQGDVAISYDEVDPKGEVKLIKNLTKTF